jgi:Holliday junction resolvase RusA-like endonuclease
VSLVLPMDRWPMPPSVAPFLVRIPKAPQVAQRGRCGCLAGHGHVYDDAEYKVWKDAAVWLLKGAYKRPPIVVPVVVAVEAVFARPSSAPKRWTMGGKTYAYPWPWTEDRRPHIGTVDLDNLTKAALDACVQGGVLQDDRLVVRDGGSGKSFAAVGESACVEVRFYPAW